ncbi:MAG: glutathione S-transferase family protein, partial [Pseudomonadota bacterium]
GQCLSMNPHGKVPVVRDGSRLVWESNTIMRYLADTYATDTWIATDAYSRTLVDRWLDWSIDRLEPAFVSVFWGYYRTPPEQHDNTAIAAAVDDCEACLHALSTQLSDQDFLLGDLPTLADIATGVFLYRLATIALPVVFPPTVACWYERLTQRRGYRRWVMSDFSELKGRSSY